MTGGAVFTTGVVDTAKTATDRLTSEYNFTIDLNTSFNGNDSLYAQLTQGNQNELAMDSSETDSTLTVSSLFYTFPVGEFSVTTGPLLDADDVISATTSIYSDSFRLSSMPWGTESVGTMVTGPGVAVAWANDSGINASFAAITDNGESANAGILTRDGQDHYVASLGYDSDNYGGGLILTNDDNTTSNEDTSFGAGIYFRPDGFPTISLSYDSLDPGATGTADSSSFMVGMDYEVGPGTASAAYESRDTTGTTTSNYEFYYNYPVNDGVSVQGGVFIEENATAGRDDTTGYIVETFFSF
jgi:hypothetical protein